MVSRRVLGRVDDTDAKHQIAVVRSSHRYLEGARPKLSK